MEDYCKDMTPEELAHRAYIAQLALGSVKYLNEHHPEWCEHDPWWMKLNPQWVAMSFIKRKLMKYWK